MRCFLVFALVAGLSVGQVQAEVSIDYSTTIDYRIDEEVSIVNGVDSLPNVRFVEGAYLAERPWNLRREHRTLRCWAIPCGQP